MGVGGRKEAYHLRGIRMLVVDEFPFMVNLMTSMLREFGVGHVRSTCDVSEANAGFDKSALIDIAVLDLMGPTQEGVDLLKWSRSQKADNIKFLPVLFCSAYTSIDVVCEARDNGANEIMVKPLSAEKLAQRLLYIIDKPRPCIKAPNFFGPDRRRKQERFKGDEKRTRSEDDVIVSREKE